MERQRKERENGGPRLTHCDLPPRFNPARAHTRARAHTFLIFFRFQSSLSGVFSGGPRGCLVTADQPDALSGEPVRNKHIRVKAADALSTSLMSNSER